MEEKQLQVLSMKILEGRKVIMEGHLEGVFPAELGFQIELAINNTAGLRCHAELLEPTEEAIAKRLLATMVSWPETVQEIAQRTNINYDRCRTGLLRLEKLGRVTRNENDGLRFSLNEQ